MITHPQTKTMILEQLHQLTYDLASYVDNLSDEKLEDRAVAIWSAGDYLKHLILSVKPVVKALGFGKEQIQTMFGAPDHPSHTYDEVAAKYEARLAEGVKAEDYDKVVPTFYRIPEGTTDVKAYLIDTWTKSNMQLITTMQDWSEEDIDTHQLPHPAIGMLTVREMLLFTLHHNTMHFNDIKRVSA